MRNIARLFLPKFSEEKRSQLMTQVAQFIKEHTKPIQLIFFGSITREDFDKESDIDVIAIFNSPEEATAARKMLYTTQRLAIEHSIEILCVDQKRFNEQSAKGGVYFMAREHGKYF